jgi:hypothetical protein
MSTPEAARMAQIVAANAGLLKEAGFRKRRYCFNRRSEDGLVHVVFFWMAPKEPPAWTRVPGLRERLYGTFRLEFGVHVPEMTRSHVVRSDWVNIYDCQLRRTIGQLVAVTDRDAWWPLSDPTAEQRASEALLRHGLPWLSRFPDHDAIVDQFRAGGPHSVGMEPAAGLDIAEMLNALGRQTEARKTLEDYVSAPVLRTHAGYLAEYLSKIGHPDLALRIKT